MANFRILTHQIQQLIRKTEWIAIVQADPLEAVNVAEGFHQLHDVRLAVEIVAVISQVLSDKDVLPAIALFKLAKKAGYKYPWLGFIPFAQTYLEFVLPRREFNLLIKTKKRNYMGIVFLVLSLFGTSIIVALNVVPAVGQLLDILLPIVLIAMAWRKKYDMLVTFRSKELALPISIISIFVPWVYTIVLIFSMNQEPEYGVGNYYNVYMEDH